MLSLFGSSMDNMITHLGQVIRTSPLVDMKPVFQSMALDVISKCAFGVELNTFKNPDSELYAKAKEIGSDFQLNTAVKTFFFHLSSVMTGKANIHQFARFFIRIRIFNAKN